LERNPSLACHNVQKKLSNFFSQSPGVELWGAAKALHLPPRPGGLKQSRCTCAHAGKNWRKKNRPKQIGRKWFNRRWENGPLAPSRACRRAITRKRNWRERNRLSSKLAPTQKKKKQENAGGKVDWDDVIGRLPEIGTMAAQPLHKRPILLSTEKFLNETAIQPKKNNGGGQPGGGGGALFASPQDQRFVRQNKGADLTRNWVFVTSALIPFPCCLKNPWPQLLHRTFVFGL